MATYQHIRKTLQRRLSESDLDRLRCVVDSNEKPCDSQSERHTNGKASPAHSLRSSNSSFTSPEPPPIPPTDDLPVEHARYEDKKKKGLRWTPFTALKVAMLRTRSSGGERGEVSNAPPEPKSSNDFARHVRWRNRIISRGTNVDDNAHVMSSALPNRSSNTIQQDSLISDSLHLDRAEVSDLAEQHRRARTCSFNRHFSAADILHPTGFDAFSDVFSQQGIHELSRCATPRIGSYGLDNKVLSRHVRNNIGDVLLNSRAGQATFPDRCMCSTQAPSAGIATTLPTEVLQAIYHNLGPLDFNAARRTCISWITASLDVDILAEQIKRGGFWAKASSKLALFQEWRPWPMSCYFARECAFAGNWTGQGLSTYTHQDTQSNPMRESCQADFQQLVQSTSGSSEEQSGGSPVCMTSTCGRYFVLTAGAEIYMYEIEGRSLRLLSRTSCEKRVLAMTIDATPEKFVLAALLEGRIGLYIDMVATAEPVVTRTQWESAGALRNISSASAPIMDLGENDGAGSSEVAAGELDEVSLNAASVGESTFLHQSVEIATQLQRPWPEYFHGGRARLRGIRQLPPLSGNGVWPSTLSFNEKENGKKSRVKALPQVVYRNVCFEDNPHTSIAISPTRQCIAFGCKGGVEIYWIDPSTGQNLNRYFPLTKPSDHLYFLPPRRHTDSTLRLRLISSTVYAPPKDEDEEKRHTQNPQVSFWFTLTGPWRFPRAARHQAHGVDHSHAVPLSDGHHILFTDNETGLLCLGSDKPVSNVQRLSRKFVFQPLTHITPDAVPWTPTLYAATKILDNGVRIVAAYGDNIVLYSVPIDALKYSTAEQEETIQDSSKPFEELQWLDILPHPTSNAQAVREDGGSPIRCEWLNMLWAHYLPSFGENGLASLDTLWPLRIQGTLIGSLDGLRALSVQETVMDGLIVWAFGRTGLSKAWEVDNGQESFEKTYSTVVSNGLVREGERAASGDKVASDSVMRENGDLRMTTSLLIQETSMDENLRC